MSADTFKNKLLQSVSLALTAKRKSLRHRGDFHIEFGADDAGEWLRAKFKRASGPVVVIELLDSGFANVYLESARRADRHKVLYRREGIRVVGNATRVCAAFIAAFEIAEYADASHAALDAAWKKCSVSAAPLNAC